MTSIRKTLALTAITGALFSMGAFAQVTPTGDTGIDATGNTQSERNACMTGRTQQDQATCLREATNARAEKSKGALTTEGDLTANALARCGVLSGTDRVACEARVLGYGGAAGSVAGGGMIKEVEIISVPADPSQPVRIEPQTSAPVILTVPAPAQ
ncbi:MAG: hypothetical protein EOO28_17350 [Comamonadaceae bacterium]|nr:MAG: hypothetical protein EOO28_17350 [Comamonadaceae bacterium]